MTTTPTAPPGVPPVAGPTGPSINNSSLGGVDLRQVALLSAGVAASVIPGVGEAMDAAILADPRSAWWERALAGASLTINVAAGGVLPNAAGIILVARGAAKTVGHHADPKFLGGARAQSLTRLSEEAHKSLHRDLNSFLRTRVDEFGNHMRPQRGNSGQVIRQNFSKRERLDAMRDFYRGPGAKYSGAARDFFSQHPGL